MYVCMINIIYVLRVVRETSSIRDLSTIVWAYSLIWANFTFRRYRNPRNGHRLPPETATSVGHFIESIGQMLLSSSWVCVPGESTNPRFEVVQLGQENRCHRYSSYVSG